MSNLPITITVKLLAPYQEAEGLSELKLQFTQETPVSQVLERLSATPPPVLGAIAHLAPLSISFLGTGFSACSTKSRFSCGTGRKAC
ncbi:MULTISPECIES: hypothetical protein [unclassified Microcoleus]|uniref:hypothetical protein n=1 Tax=unclassified Microcoleus TaxID=2642155 RepID=UPI002FCF086C